MKKNTLRITLLVGLVVTSLLSTPAFAADDEPPIPDPPPSNPFLQQAFIADEDISLAPYVDIAITDIHTSQGGYQAQPPNQDEAAWQAIVEVTNFGTASTGHFEVFGSIGRFPVYTSPIDLSLIWDSNQWFGEIDNLDPGDSEIIESPLYGFSGLALDSIYDLDQWVMFLPNIGEIFLSAQADHLNEVNENNETNNLVVTTFIYPSAPFDVTYYPNQDLDGDGVYPPPDCNDNDPTMHQGAVDILGDGIDQDCLGGPDDSPVPGHCGASGSRDIDQDGDGYTENQGDCCDLNSSIYPGADEEGPNGFDDDCDNLVDEGILFPDPDIQDTDEDGYTVADGDCDDLNAAVSPGQNELDDGLDNDCDGWVDEYLYIPDWSISNFIVWRDHSDCRQPYTHTEEWGNGESCGLRYVWFIDNIGEAIGPEYIEEIRGITYMTDLVRDYYLDIQQSPILGTTIRGEGYFPYYGYAFQTPEMLDLMACGPIGFAAIIPGAEWGGPFGEQNLANNHALDYPPENNEGIDIKFRTDSGVDVYYPDSLDHRNGKLGIHTDSLVDGSCPPPQIVDYMTQVRIFQNGNLIRQQEKPLHGRMETANIARPPKFLYTFNTRPNNDDEIVIEILLNSDGRVPETNSDNNLCRLELRYDRAGLLGGWSNDVLVLENDPQNCEGFLHFGGSDPVPITQSLFGGLAGLSNLTNIQWIGIVGAGLIIAISGSVTGWVMVARLGNTTRGKVLSALTGVVVSGILAAGLITGIAYVRKLTGTSISSQRLIAAEKLKLIIDSEEEDKPVDCSHFLETTLAESKNAEGDIEDLIIQIQPDLATIPNESRFRITVWDNDGKPYVFTTQEKILSLVSVGLFPGIINPFLWQVQVETLASGTEDIFLRTCIPVIHSSAFISEPIAVEEAGEVEEPAAPSPKDTPIPTKDTQPTAQPSATQPPPPTDTSGPKVSGANASPNPALTTSPVTISATISDDSGVANATVFYKTGKGSYQSAGGMKSGGGNQYFLNIGTLTPAGTYTFRIHTVDSLGNDNCSSEALDSCPGGSFVVHIP